MMNTDTEILMAQSTIPGSEINAQSMSISIALAESQNLEVVRGTENELLLDLDTPEAVAKYELMVPLINLYFSAVESARWASKSGNTHVMLKLTEPLPVSERLLLQSCLGSDQKRDFLTFVRHKKFDEAAPVLLFKPKATVA